MNLFALLLSDKGQRWQQDFFRNLWSVVNDAESLKQAEILLLANSKQQVLDQGSPVQQLTTENDESLSAEHSSLSAEHSGDDSISAVLQSDTQLYYSINSIVKIYGSCYVANDNDLTRKLLIAVAYARLKLLQIIVAEYGDFYACLVLNSSSLMNIIKNFVRYHEASLSLSNKQLNSEFTDYIDQQLNTHGLANLALFVVLLEGSKDDCNQSSLESIKALSSSSSTQQTWRLAEEAASLNRLLARAVNNSLGNPIFVRTDSFGDVLENNVIGFFNTSEQDKNMLVKIWQIKLQSLDHNDLPLYVALLHELYLLYVDFVSDQLVKDLAQDDSDDVAIARKKGLLKKLNSLYWYLLITQAESLRQSSQPTELLNNTIAMLKLRFGDLSHNLRAFIASRSEFSLDQADKFDAALNKLRTIAQKLIPTNMMSFYKPLDVVFNIADHWPFLSERDLVTVATDDVSLELQNLVGQCKNLYSDKNNTELEKLLLLLQNIYSMRLLPNGIDSNCLIVLQQILVANKPVHLKQELVANRFRLADILCSTYLPESASAAVKFAGVRAKTREVIIVLVSLVLHNNKQLSNNSTTVLLNCLTSLLDQGTSYLEDLKSAAETIEQELGINKFLRFINRCILWFNKILLCLHLPELDLINTAGPLLTKINELVELIKGATSPRYASRTDDDEHITVELSFASP
jgi:hypothetical protein